MSVFPASNCRWKYGNNLFVIAVNSRNQLLFHSRPLPPFKTALCPRKSSRSPEKCREYRSRQRRCDSRIFPNEQVGSLMASLSPTMRAGTSGNHRMAWPSVCPPVHHVFALYRPKMSSSPVAKGTRFAGVRYRKSELKTRLISRDTPR